MKLNHTLLKLLIASTIASIALSGCSTSKSWFGKRDNGSLDYQNSELLAPIQIPADKQTQSFTPLYPTVNVGHSDLNVTNEAGKQYRLPAPQRTIN